MRLRSLRAHKNRRKLFWTLNFLFLGAAFYYLYVGNIFAVLSMLFVSIYLQTLIKMSTLEERLDSLLSTESNSL